MAAELLFSRVNKLMHLQFLSSGISLRTKLTLELGLVNCLMIIHGAFLRGAVVAALKVAIYHWKRSFRFLGCSVGRLQMGVQNTPEPIVFATNFTVETLLASVSPLVAVPDILRLIAIRTEMTLEGALVCVASFVACQVWFRGKFLLADRARVSSVFPSLVETHMSLPGKLTDQLHVANLARVLGVTVLAMVDLHVTVQGGHR